MLCNLHGNIMSNAVLIYDTHTHTYKSYIMRPTFRKGVQCKEQYIYIKNKIIPRQKAVPLIHVNKPESLIYKHSSETDIFVNNIVYIMLGQWE